MKLPNGHLAVVAEEKLTGYLLNLQHPHGRTHASLFRALLEIEASSAERLRAALLEAALNGEAVAGKASNYGQKYEIRFPMSSRHGTYNVLSVWIIVRDEEVPRLVTAYVE